MGGYRWVCPYLLLQSSLQILGGRWTVRSLVDGSKVNVVPTGITGQGGIAVDTRFRAVREVVYECTCGCATVIQPGSVVQCGRCAGVELEQGVTARRMTAEEAGAFLRDPANREVVVQELRKVCRERPEWWVGFLERENRVRGGGRLL